METDSSAKISGFGIGELGTVPETTPYDEMVADEISRKSGKSIARRYRAIDSFTDAVKEFDTVEEMLNFARTIAIADDAEKSICLYAPGYSVGELLSYPSGKTILSWRKPIKLEHPITYCEECGGDVHHGRCIVCGEDSMITTTWTEWEKHEEILIGENHG